MNGSAQGAAIELAVRKAYEAYFSCFQRLDAEATAAHFAAPLLRIAAGAAEVLPADADVRAMLQRTWAGLAAKSYSGSTIESDEVTVLDECTVLLRVRGGRHDHDGQALERFDVLYTLVRPEPLTTWRIAVLTSLRPGA